MNGGNSGGQKRLAVGDILESNNYGKFTIEALSTQGKAKIKFINTGYELWTNRHSARTGKVKDKSYLDKYKEGNIFESMSYGQFKVVEYFGAGKIKVEFLKTGYTTTTCRAYIDSGKIADKLLPSVCGVGFIGIGEYGTTNHRALMDRWFSMIQRCYSDNNQPEAYRDKYVCNEWHNFQNFASWCVTQIGYGKKDYELDKDILFKGNKVYSPENCCFVPKRINSMIIKTGRKPDGLIYGVRVCKSTGNYIASYRDHESSMFSFHCKSLELAEKFYIEGKESSVKIVADMYKDEISPEAYNALISWRVVDG